MAKRKIPKVNMYDAELKLEKLVEQAQKDKHIKKTYFMGFVSDLEMG